MEGYESRVNDSSDTSQAGQTPAEKLLAGIPLPREERLGLPLDNDYVAREYLVSYGGGQKVGNRTVICDGHQAYMADETNARWEQEKAQGQPVASGLPSA